MADEGDTTVRRINIGITADEDDIKMIPTELNELLGGGRNEHRLIITENRLDSGVGRRC